MTQVLRYDVYDSKTGKRNYVYPKQRDFVRFVLKKEWKEVHRVQVSEINRKAINSNTFDSWCKEHVSGHWSKSDENEVFYFESIEDAILFRLRWTGHLTNDGE